MSVDFPDYYTDRERQDELDRINPARLDEEEAFNHAAWDERSRYGSYRPASALEHDEAA